MNDFETYLALIPRYRMENPNQRDGQAHFNVLCDVRLDIANEISGGPVDPFYLDERLPAFLEFVAAQLARGEA